MSIEQMSDFFTDRVDMYDEHMIKNVEGCKEGYIKMAELLPKEVNELLDLGCGTGLELDEIFKTKPFINVTGIDLTQAMLDKLKQKYPSKNLSLINANYFDYDFGISKYDAAVSFQTMHHFSHEDKLKLYIKIFNALKTNGQYIECDYMSKASKRKIFIIVKINEYVKNRILLMENFIIMIRHVQLIIKLSCYLKLVLKL